MEIHTLGLGRPFTFSGETESGISGEQSGYVSARSDRRDEWEEIGVMECGVMVGSAERRPTEDLSFLSSRAQARDPADVSACARQLDR